MNETRRRAAFELTRDTKRCMLWLGRFRRMKIFIPYFTFIMLAFSQKSWPQGTIILSHGFEINWTGALPPGSSILPYGAADLINNALLNNAFFIYVNIGPTAANQGWVVELETDGSFSPVFEITNQSSWTPIFPGQTWPINYVAQQNWQVTDS